MRSMFLIVMLLCVWCAAQVQIQDSKNTVRLCGRALLRAVVYSCGGSRWRRLTEGEEAFPDGSRDPNHRATKADVAPVMGRHWRDINQDLISVCCRQGCQRSDLSMLC